MFALRFVNRAKPAQHVRLISNCPTLRDSKPEVSKVQESTTPPPSSNPSVIGRNMITPRNFDKRVLVWMKVYKSIDEVPERITYEAMDKAQNRFRIRCANLLMVGTLVGCAFMVYYGKERAERGESLQQMNIDWHKKINADHQAELNKAAAEK